MVKATHKPKLKSIIKTYLICTGPKSAREISEFVDKHEFGFGKSSFSASEISRLLRYNYDGILRDLKVIDGNPKKYYFSSDVYVRRDENCCEESV